MKSAAQLDLEKMNILEFTTFGSAFRCKSVEPVSRSFFV